jgi:hypothetical protein
MEISKSITKRQREIIVGTLLGDAHLETRSGGKTYRLKIEHAKSQLDYAKWKHHELRSIASSEIKMKTVEIDGKSYEKIWWNSSSTPSLRFYGHQFYGIHGKKIPKLIHRWLTPLALAVWYMDDGSIKSKNHKAKIINTQSYKKEEVELLCQVLNEKYKILAKLRKQKEGYQIYLLSETIDIFTELIRPYIIPTMRYKID